MARLIYAAICSLDGFVNDADGNFDWAMPDEEEHAFVNELESSIGTYIYGRRMYEIMQVWADFPGIEDEPEVVQNYAKVWAGADKHVFSATLTSVSTARTHLHRVFDPERVRELKENVAHDVSIGGPTVAAAALRAGLVDDIHLLLHPVLIGTGTPVFPSDFRHDLELLEQRQFASGVVHLHYRV